MIVACLIRFVIVRKFFGKRAYNGRFYEIEIFLSRRGTFYFEPAAVNAEYSLPHREIRLHIRERKVFRRFVLIPVGIFDKLVQKFKRLKLSVVSVNVIGALPRGVEPFSEIAHTLYALILTKPDRGDRRIILVVVTVNKRSDSVRARRFCLYRVTHGKKLVCCQRNVVVRKAEAVPYVFVSYDTENAVRPAKSVILAVHVEIFSRQRICSVHNG